MIGRRAWVVALAAVVIAVGVGLQKLAGAGASAMILQVVGGVVALGLIGAGPWLSKQLAGDRSRWAVVVGGVGLLLLPLLQPGVEGAHRWVMLGPVVVQPLPLVLPLLVWLAVREDLADPRWIAPGSIGLALAGLALGVQPDQQGAGAALAVSLAALWLWNRPVGVNSGRRWIVAGICFVGVILTAFRPRELEPVAHVEGVIHAGFEIMPVMGAVAVAALIATLLLIVAVAWVPATTTASERVGMERTGWLLAVLWAALVVGSLGAEYPVPVIGYGLSWVIGWGLTLGLAVAERRRVPKP